MPFQLSPGVNVSEIDLTTIVPSVATSIGAFAGIFAWGPVNEVVTLSDELRLVDRFGKPNSNNFTYWFSASNFLSYSNNLKTVRAGNTSSSINATANGQGIVIFNEDTYPSRNTTTATAQGPWAAKYPGVIGNSLKVSICSNARAFSNTTTLVVDSDDFIGNTVVEMTNAANFDIIVGSFVSFGTSSVKYKVSAINSANIVLSTALVENISAATPVTSYWEYADNVTGAPGTSAFASGKSATGDELHVIVEDENGEFTGIPGTILEVYEYLSKASDAKTEDGSSNYYVDVINNRSKYIWWLTRPTNAGANWGNAAQGTTYTQTNNRPITTSLAGGADGQIDAAEIILAYDKFANADEVDVSLVIAGPAEQTVASHLIDNIALVRKDCVVFLSPQRANVIDNAGDEADDIVTYRNLLTSSSYAVMDSNWKYQYDKYNDTYRWIPCNADIAGLCARTDQERDPWFSPGGLNRGILKNVIKLAWNPNKTDRDTLYVKGINPVVTFSGEGTVLFGDKTLQSKPSAFDRINVRRLFIVLEKSIARAARFSLFEFNDQFTRAQFVSLVEPFLRDVQGRRGIFDFRVVCDETNNTGEVIDRNEFVGDIYIKPARSINFIQLNFVAVRTGVSFDEVVGKF